VDSDAEASPARQAMHVAEVLLQVHPPAQRVAVPAASAADAPRSRRLYRGLPRVERTFQGMPGFGQVQLRLIQGSDSTSVDNSYEQYVTVCASSFRYVLLRGRGGEGCGLRAAHLRAPREKTVRE